MLRSLDIWSGGITQTETSILNAYCSLIENAEHYIYIEVRIFNFLASSIYFYFKESIFRNNF